jgi:hypothetical protein
MATELFRPKEGITFDFQGAPVFIDPTTLVEAGHPIMKGREHLFEPVYVQFANPKAAEDSKGDEGAPRSAVKPDQAGARSRSTGAGGRQ